VKQAKRFNKGKLRWRNMPLWLFKPVIQVANFGESKYDTYNYLKGFPVSDLLDCLKRHLVDFEDPTKSDFDSESKAPTMAHVAWNAIVICFVMKFKPEFDDRYNPNKENENDKT